jgi:hypothetical protein
VAIEDARFDGTSWNCGVCTLIPKANIETFRSGIPSANPAQMRIIVRIRRLSLASCGPAAEVNSLRKSR